MATLTDGRQGSRLLLQARLARASTSWERCLSAAALLAVVGAAAAALLHRAPPLQDLPEWMFQGWLLKELALGHAHVGAVAELVNFPVPNALLQALLAVLNFVCDPLTAGKVAVLLYLAGGYAVIIVTSRRAPVELRGSLQVLLVVLILLSQLFWNGYLAYQLGLIVLAALLLWIQQPSQHNATRLPQPVLLAAFGMVMFFTHAVAYGGYVLAVGFLALRVRSARVLLAVLPSALLAGWYAVGFTLRGGASDPVSVRWMHGLLEAILYKLYTAAKWGPFVNFYLAPKESALGNMAVAYWMGVVLNAVTGIAILALAFWCVLRLRDDLWKHAPIAAGSAVVCLAVFAALPATHMLGVVNFGERMMGVGLVAGLVALASLRDRRVVLPLRTLALLAVLGLPYLAVPVLTVEARSPAPEAAKAENRLEQYYTDQRYFNTRCNQFSDKVDFLRLVAARGQTRPNGQALPLIPGLVFETSMLVSPPPAD